MKGNTFHFSLSRDSNTRVQAVRKGGFPKADFHSALPSSHQQP